MKITENNKTKYSMLTGNRKYDSRRQLNVLILKDHEIDTNK